MKILFTICGRAGSKGFKNKNLKELNGVPIVYYTLSAIWGFFAKHPEHQIQTVLNTDSQELKKLVMNQDILSPIKFVPRKNELAGDRVAKIEVIKDTYLTMAQQEQYDVIIDLDITSPVRTIEDIENVLKVYLSNAEFDVVFSVVDARRSPYFNMVERKKDGFYRKICESDFITRQETPCAYELNASIYAYSPSFLRRENLKTILDYRCGIAQMKDYLVLDIDSESDFEMMQYLHKYYCEYDVGIYKIYQMAEAQVNNKKCYNNKLL